MAQLFVNDQGYMKITPMKLKSEAAFALKELIQDVGIPYHMHTDEAKETTLGTWQKTCKEHSIAMSNTEPHSPFQNRAEAGIGELKRHVNRFMARTNAPKKLWDFCATYTADLRNRLALPLFQLHGRTPIEALTGNTPDISEFLEFDWYQPVWIYDSAPFPEQRRNIGRWLGIAHRVGQAMCYWVLPQSGVPIARSTIQVVTADELKTETVITELATYDSAIKARLGTTHGDSNADIDLLHLYMEDEDGGDDFETEPFEPEARVPDVDVFEADQYDELLLRNHSYLEIMLCSQPELLGESETKMEIHVVIIMQTHC